VLSIAAGTVIACEVRLSREHAGQLSPTAVKLRNLHLLDQALALAARWTPAIAVVIRLDPQPFDETELARLIAARLAQARIKPSQITIEISERDFTPAVLERNDWRFMSNLGVKISVCDLGRGPIPIDVIAAPWISKCKLDGALVQDLPTRESERRKARAVVGIAAGLRLRVGAADVATPEQFAAAAEVGCTEAQGAGCADWLKPDAFAHWLEARRARSAI